MPFQRGFTYVELLVVAALVLILVATLWLTVLKKEVEKKDDLVAVATDQDAANAVLARLDAKLESVTPIKNEELELVCSEFHNIGYKVVVSQQLEEDSEPIWTEATACCKGLGRSRYCFSESERTLPPPEPTP